MTVEKGEERAGWPSDSPRPVASSRGSRPQDPACNLTSDKLHAGGRAPGSSPDLPCAFKLSLALLPPVLDEDGPSVIFLTYAQGTSGGKYSLD